MFPSLAARETCVAETNFAAWKTKHVFALSQKHFCLPEINFASETYVSQYSHSRKHNKKHCFRNNVSLFSQAFTIPLSDELMVSLTLIVIVDSAVYNCLFCRFSPLCCVSNDFPGFYEMFGFT